MRRTTNTLLMLAMVSATSLSECLGEDTQDGATPAPASTTAGDAAIEMIRCYGRANGSEDCDRDGVLNSADVVPARNDLGDDDDDTVLNKWDRYAGFDDRDFDIDKDGTADYLDTFFGDNNQDADGDRLANGVDPQPYAPPPSGIAVQPPPNISNQLLSEYLLHRQMAQKYSDQLLSPRPDKDFDGIPNEEDTTPTQATNDRDHDGDADFYDPEPKDPAVYAKNDPYDPRNDEYWEK